MDLKKWVDELQARIDDLKTKLAVVNSKMPNTIIDVDDPLEGQLLTYDATHEKFVNANPPEPGSSYDYSTTEAEVGTWIDGKPIYRIVIDKHSSPINGTGTVDVSALKIETLVRSDAIGSDISTYGTSNMWTLNSVSGSRSRVMYLSNLDTLKFEGDYYKFYIILEYTKRTVTE